MKTKNGKNCQEFRNNFMAVYDLVSIWQKWCDRFGNSMNDLEIKDKILNEYGFVYDYEREIYFNRDKHKILSVRFIDKNTEDTLRNYINEPVGLGVWSFGFLVPPSENVMNQIINSLES